MGKHDKPRLTLPAPKPAETSESIEAPVPVSLLGETVIVKTPTAIGGQHEHAAVVTFVYDDDAVDVLLMPRASEPYPVARIAKSGPMSWRFRS